MQTLKELAISKFDHLLYRKNLQEKIEAQLCVTHNSGMFKATPELISFLHCWDSDFIVLEDAFHNPVLCDRPALLVDLKQAYQFAMNAWQIEFEQSKKIRKGSNV